MNRYEQSAYVVVVAESEEEADAKIVKLIESVNSDRTPTDGYVSLDDGHAELVDEDVDEEGLS